MLTQLSFLQGSFLNLRKEIYMNCPYKIISQSKSSVFRTAEAKIGLSFHTLPSNCKKTIHLTTGAQAKADGPMKLI